MIPFSLCFKYYDNWSCRSSWIFGLYFSKTFLRQYLFFLLYRVFLLHFIFQLAIKIFYANFKPFQLKAKYITAKLYHIYFEWKPPIPSFSMKSVFGNDSYVNMAQLCSGCHYYTNSFNKFKNKILCRFSLLGAYWEPAMVRDCWNVFGWKWGIAPFVGKLFRKNNLSRNSSTAGHFTGNNIWKNCR